MESACLSQQTVCRFLGATKPILICGELLMLTLRWQRSTACPKDWRAQMGKGEVHDIITMLRYRSEKQNRQGERRVKTGFAEV